MKIFKNGLNLKWLLLITGIVVILGFAAASANPIISNTDSYLDNLYTTYIHGNGSNLTGVIIKDNGNAKQWVQGNISFGSINGTLSSYGFYSHHDVVVFDALIQLPSTDNALCMTGVNGRVYYNGAQTCTVSDKYKKENGIVVTEEMMGWVRQLQLMQYNDIADPAKRNRIGFYAQDVAKISPMLAGTDYRGIAKPIGVVVDFLDGREKMQYSDGKLANITSVNYEIIAAIEAKAIQEQQFKIEILQNQMRNICSNNPQLCS